ncbi:unnamed protein product [Clavelina lepadiformis]|uniref:Epoxide hydrolase n=1 Tax=Clavelina lepadiformis TaxID=159417 RepID=A0ABP0GE54_CLALP
MISIIFCILALALAVYAIVKWQHGHKSDPDFLSQFFPDKSWSLGDDGESNTEVINFKINISNAKLDDLRSRLDLTKYPVASFSTSKFNYGIRDDYIRKLTEYWKNEYSWKKQEQMMNKYSHYKTMIEGLNIHFIHCRPKKVQEEKKVILLIHGWPGSFVEYLETLDRFTTPTSNGGNETDAFTVVCPSIPGFGFSDPPQKEGFNGFECARVFHKLMLRLGYVNYYVAGGDWGSLISRCMSLMYPSCVNGCYTTMLTGSTGGIEMLYLVISAYIPTFFYNKMESKVLFPLKALLTNSLLETGYFHLQATKPDTVGFALSDSPVGMAAYIIEKFSTWTDLNGRQADDGLLQNNWTFDQLLNNVMIYWWSENITSSLRFYKENSGNRKLQPGFRLKVHVPAGYGWYPNEFIPTCKRWVENNFSNLIHFTYMKKGGHFNAFEVPDMFVEDVRVFVRKVEALRSEQLSSNLYKTKPVKLSHLDRYKT